MRRTIIVAAAVVVAVTSALTAAETAAAAGIIDVSNDGVTYGSTYPGTLFDPSFVMIPGASQAKVFYVRNSGNETGTLRVTMENVSSNDVDFADALTVSVSTPGHPGIPASISKASPCWALAQGLSVAPGQSIAVTTKALLGDLNGTAGQGATAGLTIRVTLSALGTPTPAPTACSSGASADVVAFTPAGGNLRTLALPTAPGGVATSTAVQPPKANTQLPTLAVPGSDPTVDPNTWRLYQELLVILMVTALILGSGWYGVLAWLRRRRANDGGGA